MEEAIAKVVIPAVVGVVTGAIGSLFAPWANWGVEKKRQRLQARRLMVERWRQVLSDPELEQRIFAGSPEYSALRPYLPKKLVNEIEDDRTFREDRIRAGGVGALAPDILDEVARIEREEWKLL